MIHIDYAVSEDFINIDSYGEICVRCGCCESRSSSYRNMIRNRIRYYKTKLQENKDFESWSDNDWLRKLQEENIKANILYFKRKIRVCKKILRTIRKGGAE